jgi:hypothetical protein
LKRDFPNLSYTNSNKTSEATDTYNCLAWAIGINNKYLWPNSIYWPNDDLNGPPNKITFKTYFEKYLKYFEVTNKDHVSYKTVIPGYQKIAIYIDNDNLPSHFARQLPNGMWTSKLGDNIDITHNTLEVLEGPVYGKVGIIMAKKIDIN